MSFRNSLLLVLVSLLTSLLTAGITSAQTIMLDDLPPTTGNSRFFSDRFDVKHPSLSANGFDCGSLCGNGLGIKQIL
jgi:hypothetical protein